MVDCVFGVCNCYRLNEAISDDSDSDESGGSCQKGVGDLSYSSRVEFALKLGYTELQVQKALSKLGPNPAQNELLAELIRLASLTSSSGGSAAAVANSGGDLNDNYQRQLKSTCR